MVVGQCLSDEERSVALSTLEYGSCERFFLCFFLLLLLYQFYTHLCLALGWVLYIVGFIQSSQGLQDSVFCLHFTGQGSNTQRGFVFLQITQLVRKEFRGS